MTKILVISPSVTICDDWTKVVNVRHLLSSLWRSAHPGIIVFLIMQLLGLENPLYLVGNCSVRVIPTSIILSTQVLVDRREVTRPRSGPTSLNPVVSVLEATQPEIYTTSE